MKRDEVYLTDTASITVSVIVPIRGHDHALPDIVKLLESASYKWNAELIVVFNGPIPDNVRLPRSERIRTEHVPNPLSPYSARNRGIEIAQGKHVAFLDATCVPGTDWLGTGLAELEAGSDLVAGRVEFRFAGNRATAAELWDSVINVQQEQAVARGVAKTANLFVSGQALRSLGPFREGVRSGEDVRWSGRASTLGLRLSYCPQAVVYKSARRLPSLLRKALRVGAGQAALYSFWSRTSRIVAMAILPPSPPRILRAVEHAGINGRKAPWLVIRLMAVAWCVQISQGIGLLVPNRFRQAD